MVAKVRERLAIDIQRSQRFNMERFNLENVNEVEDEKKYCIEVPSRFADLEDLCIEVEIVIQKLLERTKFQPKSI
jgi:lipoate-protein ligase A